MFKKYKSMNLEELKETFLTLKAELDDYKNREKVIEKKLKKHLYWFFLIPLFGFIIFNIVFTNRKQKSVGLIEIKQALAHCELELKVVENEIEIKSK